MIFLRYKLYLFWYLYCFAPDEDLCSQSVVLLQCPRSREGLLHSTGFRSKWWNGQGSHCLLQTFGSTSCTEATPALQHNNGVASHSTEFRLAEISSPVPARLSYQEVTACVQQPRPGPDGQRGLSWTLTLHAIPNSTKSRMILLTKVS